MPYESQGEEKFWTHLMMTNLRHGTVFFTQVSVKGSMSSTMTKGASSKVTMLRWLLSGSLSLKEFIRGQTEYLWIRVLFSHFPACNINKRM